ncbi:hypothetical protein PSHT_03884 [Puccinia striiformis]|uniref:Glucose-methanol-choline oxidoreductase N-terminal domain-containing protein n=1 Tax=Puccinia striiformis TaxID=27350 RepID=A0A2S4WE62_9BASI|nr:hypothetical protein PSHT_03884 [Puccinia striiformis]
MALLVHPGDRYPAQIQALIVLEPTKSSEVAKCPILSPLFALIMLDHGSKIFSLLFLAFFPRGSHTANMPEMFDYIVVGGGTAGMAVASRLSEDPALTVLVLEAGGTGVNNTGISIPGLVGTTLGTDVDWKYSTVPQSNQRQVYYPRGKVLGGSSAINFLINTKAEKNDYNAIENLGNPGWGWSEMDRASKKSEQFIIPEPDSPFPFNPIYHGLSGPAANSFPKYVPPQFKPYFPAAVLATVPNRAIETTDPFGGDLEGAYIFPSAIDAMSGRVTSATAYYLPIQSRSNLVVRTDALVSKLISKRTEGQALQIVGVEYSSFGTVSRAMVNKEVIMSSGSIGTPAILERSGIGKASILQSLNIPVVLDLPAVGSNLADHPALLGTYRLRSGIVSSDDLLRNATFAAEQTSIYMQTGGGLLSHGISVLDYQTLKSIVSPEELLVGMKLLKRDPSTMSENQFTAISDRILNGVAVEFLLINAFFEADNLPDPNTSYLTIATTLQHPLSRGSSHINGQDPAQSPLIDPGFLSHPFDAWLMVQAAKHARKIMSQPQYKNVILNEHYPGPSVQTDAEWLKSVKSRVRTEYHPIGTSSMMPQNQAGVVDPQLKVYGTQNLRVCSSNQIGAHPAMTVYAIAEKAAEMILKSRTGSISALRNVLWALLS